MGWTQPRGSQESILTYNCQAPQSRVQDLLFQEWKIRDKISREGL
jgi:hypothetical protein